MRILILAILIVFVSCAYEPFLEIELIIPEPHPFEDAFSETFWFTLTYFDGDSIKELHIPKGHRRVVVKVRAGSLAVFSFRPAGELGAIGGFYEPGDDKRVAVIPEYGAFAEMLLNAASYRAEPVARLSVRSVLEDVPNLQAVDEVSFMEDIFNGTLGYGITLNDEYIVRLDSIPQGVWVSERYDILSFETKSSGELVSLLLYPGVYRYAEVSRNLLLTIVVEESGEYSNMITEVPLW